MVVSRVAKKTAHATLLRVYLRIAKLQKCGEAKLTFL